MPMLEKSKKHKKVSFSEEDAATLTQRYEATTVLTLLQEVALYPHFKIDWNELVKKTSTGITNAREYQMLWRHLAYRDALPENLEDGAEPLDDDSDLECELEALPPVNGEAALEAAACVKVMIASRTLSESTPSSSTIEAPLTINVPVCHSSRTPNESSQPSNLMQGKSIIFPVTVQRQTLPTLSSTEGIETKGSVGGNVVPKRKRKAWSEEEDMQLRAAVQRWGEGNWANMAKGDNFPIRRSPTQLAQRWSILRKKDGSTNSGTIPASTQYTAEQLATRHSLSLALDMPFKKLTAPGMTDPARTSFNTSIKIPVQPCNTTETSTVHSNFVPPHLPSQQAAGAHNVSQLKVAQARNGGLSADPKVHSNVPFVCTGSSATPVPSHSAVAVTSALCTSMVKAASPTVETSTALTVLSEQDNRVTSVVTEVSLQQEANLTNPSPAPIERVQEDETLDKGRQDLDQGKIMNLPAKKGGEASIIKNTRSVEILEDKAASQNPGECQDKSTNLPVNKGGEYHSRITEDQKMNEKQENLPSMLQDESSKVLELPS